MGKLTFEQKSRTKKLIKALRSGEYQQARGYMHRPHSNYFCALGLGCYLINNALWIHTNYSLYQKEFREYYGWYRLLFNPRSVSMISPQLTPLYVFNDLGYSFNEIANTIEDTFKINNFSRFKRYLRSKFNNEAN